MYKICIAALCLLAVCEAAQIVPAAITRKAHPFGIVEGVIQCGSAGTVVQIRVTDCTRVPCRAVIGVTYQVEVDFVPSASHSGLHLKAAVIHQGESTTIIDVDVPNSPVNPGNTYTFTMPFLVTGIFQGFGDLRFEISAGGIVEVCGIAGINVSSA